jgi:hypothetical protein
MMSGRNSLTCEERREEVSNELKPSPVAVHEAGHIVAAHLIGVRFNHAHILPRGLSDGEVYVEREKDVTSARRLIDVMLAGGEAVRIYTQRETESHTMDLIRAIHLFEYYIDNETETFISYTERRVAVVGDLLRRNWHAVLSVARLLDTQKTICRHQAVAAIVAANNVEGARCGEAFGRASVP